MHLTNPLDTEYLAARDVLMRPQIGNVKSRSRVELEPFIYSAPMDSVTGYKLAGAMLEEGEYPVISRFIDEEERIRCIREFALREEVFFAVGFSDAGDFLNACAEIAQEDNWPDNSQINLALDIAHGDMKKAHFYTSHLANNDFVRYVMSGSICTSEAAIRAATNGCTHLRVGVGPGAACTTRLMTGVGMPQLSAVYNIYSSLRAYIQYDHVKIIADGGIKLPGDAAKYLGAGADGIMMGSVFSRCQESPGWYSDRDSGRMMKSYRGQASAAFQKSRYGKANACPEGASSKPFPWNGDTVESVVEMYRTGVQASCSYLGFRAITEMNPDDITFVKITPAGYLEGTAHGT